MERYDVAQRIFDYIKAEGFEVYDIRRGNGYFIFDMGDDGVIHFKIKGLHDWLFAMWINTNEEELHNDNGKDFPALQFFTQYELLLDKFKPSRSWFCENYSYDEVVKGMNDDYKYVYYDIINMLKMIKYHPLLSFYHDNWGDKYVTHKSVLWCYLRSIFYEVKSSIEDWWNEFSVYRWTKLKAAICKHYKIVDSISVVDGNGDGWKVTPRYTCHIHFKQLYFNDKQEEEELRMLNVWFRKNNWGELDIELTREGNVSESGNLIRYGYR